MIWKSRYTNPLSCNVNQLARIFLREIKNNMPGQTNKLRLDTGCQRWLMSSVSGEDWLEDWSGRVRVGTRVTPHWSGDSGHGAEMVNIHLLQVVTKHSKWRMCLYWKLKWEEPCPKSKSWVRNHKSKFSEVSQDPIGIIVFDEHELIVHVIQGLSLSTASLVFLTFCINTYN